MIFDTRGVFPLASLVGLLCIASAIANEAEERADTEERTASEEELRQWIDELDDSELQVRRDAAYEISQLGVAAVPALDALIGLLDERDAQLYFLAATAIARTGPAADAAIPALIEGLESRDEQRRYRAAYALGQAGGGETGRRRFVRVAGRPERRRPPGSGQDIGNDRRGGGGFVSGFARGRGRPGRDCRRRSVEPARAVERGRAALDPRFRR